MAAMARLKLQREAAQKRAVADAANAGDAAQGRRSSGGGVDKAQQATLLSSIGRYVDAADITVRWPTETPARRNVLARDGYVFREIGGEDCVPLFHPQTGSRQDAFYKRSALPAEKK